MRDRMPIALGSGLNLADADLALAGQARRVTNFALDAVGRLQPRRAARQVATPTGDVVGFFRFPFYDGVTSPIGAVAAVYSAGTLSLYRVGIDGVPFGAAITTYAGLSGAPALTAGQIGQKLFVTGREPGGNLEMRYFDAATDAMVTPLFIFSSGAGTAMTPRVCVVYNNILFVAGYGNEDQPGRQEYIRFSYIGLDSFGQIQQADAGIDAQSQNLFDIEDAFGAGERGLPVNGLGQAGGRLIILSERTLHHLFGYDRLSFVVEQIDPYRGLVATPAYGEANGTLWWWSPVGPCMYTGSGATDDFGRKVRPRFPDIDVTQLVFHHARSAHEARWYYHTGLEARYIGWNYERKEWTEGLSPYRVFCSGLCSKSSTDVGSDTEGSAPGPAGPPTGFTVVDATPYSLTIGFTVGDATAETEVEVNGNVVSTLDPGVAQVTLTGLTPSTTYNIDLTHKKNGQYSLTLSGSGSTDPAGTQPNGPANGVALLQGTAVLLSWELGQSNVKTEIWKRDITGGPAEMVRLAGVDETSLVHPYPCYPTPWPCTLSNIRYKLRHQDALDPSNVSAYTPEFLIAE